LSAEAIDQRSPLPKYRQLHTILSDLIDRELQADQPIPSESELQERHGLSRMTVRKAVDQLVNEKRLYRVVGVGTFVTDPATRVELHLSSFSEDMTALGIRSSQKVLSIGTREADPMLAAALRTRPGDPLVYLERVRYADEQPVCYERSCIRAALVPGFPLTQFAGSLFQLLDERYDLRPNHAEQRIAAAKADPRTAQALRIPLGDPVLRIRQQAYRNDLLVEFCTSSYRSDAYELAATVNQSGLTKVSASSY
jgi:DNA-binding GntR family transcriptional regulator